MDDDTDITEYLREKYWIRQFMEAFDAEDITDKETANQTENSSEIVLPPF
jgi:hypothetical protein